ncbi:uncharacterized exonuclease domain-containing protein At3g15140 isoform X2 [Tripterygium wilfordii]|uniref:uncharacterized exonuclease domain-containing protein At3g15140 isoform X2 n=1 Tax=Tripterygium wilfordii TaxID=458696 RepID=UPI0018F8046B|nr:uncharacterized exonuclease domain-containing protein At3g15140 isoform X2 [Tripterygium wilfordii]
MAFSRFSLSRISSLLSPSFVPLPSIRRSTPIVVRGFSLSATMESSSASLPPSHGTARWRPVCLYYTQGKCTKMDDPLHIETFNHDCCKDLHVDAAFFEHKQSQKFEFFLVLDLEGFVRPSAMSEQRINEYIEGKYGKFGVDRVWHDTALPFKEVIQQFEAWLAQHHLWGNDRSGLLNRAAFVTCGNWDLKTKVPQQCKVSKMKLPPYFMEWINLKDVYLNFYNQEARGMMAMLKQRQIRVLGSHHLGIDDTKNITRVLQRMLADGAVMQISARRDLHSPENVSFTFRNRIR